MKRSTQVNFGVQADEFREYWKESSRKVHGGENSKNKRKTKRPFDSKKPIHIVMRSIRAKGIWSLRGFRVRSEIDGLIKKYAKKFHLSLYDFSINSNHIHILLRAKDQVALSRFLKSATGNIARLVTGARKNNPKGKFWDALTFSRIGDWGRPYENLKFYVLKNILEAAGVIPYTPRRKARSAPA
jgi:putative transposase